MFQTLKKIFFSIIGYRSKKKIKMIMASCYYIFFLIVSFAMGKGFMFGLVFTFICPIFIFSVVEIIAKRNLKPIKNIGICFLLIIVFAFTVPSEQTKLSSNNTLKQTYTENNQIENLPTENQNDNKADNNNNISKPQNQNVENSAENNINNEIAKNNSKQTIIKKSDNIGDNQSEDVVIEPSDKEIDNDGFIYNVNKTYNIGMTEITVKRLIIRTSWGQYVVTMEYQINNNDNLPIRWKFSGKNKGNVIGTLETKDRRKVWMGKASNYKDEYIDKHREDGNLQAKEKITAALNFICDTEYEEPGLKENEMMNFTIYYSQNDIDSEFSVILNEK